MGTKFQRGATEFQLSSIFSHPTPDISILSPMFTPFVNLLLQKLRQRAPDCTLSRTDHAPFLAPLPSHRHHKSWIKWTKPPSFGGQITMIFHQPTTIVGATKISLYNPRPVIAYRMGIFYNYEMVFRTAII